MEEIGIVQLDEQKNVNVARAKEEQRRLKKEYKRMEIESSSSYKMTKGIATLMDKYFLDPIIGLVPGAGDVLSSVLMVPSVYVSLFKIKSLPLTLAVTFNILKDMLFGIIPYIGIVIDFINRAYIQNMRLIVGFVEDDKAIIEDVNRKALWMGILIAVFIGLIWLMFKFVANTLEWIGGLFA